MSDEEVMDWRMEAEAVIRDVGFGVKSISVSQKLPQSKTEIFFNVETKEGQKMCVELSSYGFRVMSKEFDRAVEPQGEGETYYETPYALLDSCSGQFRQCFAAALEKKLSQLPT